MIAFCFVFAVSPRSAQEGLKYASNISTMHSFGRAKLGIRGQTCFFIIIIFAWLLGLQLVSSGQIVCAHKMGGAMRGDAWVVDLFAGFSAVVRFDKSVVLEWKPARGRDASDTSSYVTKIQENFLQWFEPPSLRLISAGTALSLKIAAIAEEIGSWVGSTYRGRSFRCNVYIYRFCRYMNTERKIMICDGSAHNFW